jgi:hypothetical protein
MPFPYVVDEASRLVTVFLPPVVHGQKIAETMEAMFQDTQWKPGFNVLWDGTAIRELLMEKDDMLEFMQIQRDFSDIAGSGCDVIVTTRPLDRVMAGMYAAMMKHEARTAHVCQSMSEAMLILQTSREEAG